MDFERHCNKSFVLFNDKGAVYHRWIDQYVEKYGFTHHRLILHHQECVSRFGEV